MKRILIGAACALITLTVATPAYAGNYLDETVAALKNHHVYVAAGTENTDPTTEAKLAGQLDSSDDIAIAMLPASASGEFGGQTQAFARQLDDATGRRFIVAVAIGDQVGTSTHLLPTGVVDDLMARAISVSTNTQEKLVTFIRNVHDWQRDHPQVVASMRPQKTKSKGDGFTMGLVGIISLSALALALGFMASSHRRRDARNDQPKVKLHSPSRIHDELKDIMGLRARINDRALCETITQLVRDTEVVFDRLRKNAPQEMESASIDFEQHLQNLRDVLKQYIDIQDFPRYYEEPDQALADGAQAVNGFAAYVLNSAKRAGRRGLTEFKVNTKILSAQRYS